MNYSYIPGFNNGAGQFINDGLIAGDFPIKTKSVTLKAGQVYNRGHVLQALADADAGKFGEVAADASAKYILLEDVDATSADKVGNVAITGQFNGNKLTIGATATLAGITATLEPLSIYISTGFPGGVSTV